MEDAWQDALWSPYIIHTWNKWMGIFTYTSNNFFFLRSREDKIKQKEDYKKHKRGTMLKLFHHKA